MLGALLARRIVPEPYASGAALAVGLAPPVLAHATAVYPELTAGALLAAGALCAVAARDAPRPATVLGGALAVSLLPWLGLKYALPALPIAVALALWPARARRRLLGLAAAEVMLGALVFYATLNERLYGGPTPYAAGDPESVPFGPVPAAEYADRIPRLATLWVDADYGLLRWAPVLALALFGTWLLWRSRRDRLARLSPARATAEAAGGLALAVCLGQLLVAAFGAATMFGETFPGRQLVAGLPAAVALCAWGLRHAPRAGAALGAVTVAAGLWLAVTRDAWAPPAAWGAWGVAASAAVAAAGGALVLRSGRV